MTLANSYLTVARAAEILSVSVGTVRNLINAGELQAVRVGRSIRIHPDALTAYLHPATA